MKNEIDLAYRHRFGQLTLTIVLSLFLFVSILNFRSNWFLGILSIALFYILVIRYSRRLYDVTVTLSDIECRNLFTRNKNIPIAQFKRIIAYRKGVFAVNRWMFEIELYNGEHIGFYHDLVLREWFAEQDQVAENLTKKILTLRDTKVIRPKQRLLLPSFPR